MQLVCKPASVKFFLLPEKLKLLPSFILILHHCGIHTTYPPASGEQPLRPVYMVFQLMRCTAPVVASRTGELLPPLLTLTPVARGGYFLPRVLCPHEHLPRGSLVLCAARTFLPDFPITIGTGRWNNLLPCKGNQIRMKDQNII